eukprot:TRINITY_DN649_c0_g1_i2.p1 TRINITY_DN649_c0_g1~~TRINITY_DN649_c0_g1_i2.p1  ORF type:complete len:383 (+),score=67.66 TRINITY_DN649_c0_g1_i2:31-1179(+)
MSDLTLKIGSARGLISAAETVYCKITLGKSLEISRLGKKSRNWAWDERFQFKLDDDKNLSIDLFRHSKWTNSYIGSVFLDLSTLNTEIAGQWFPLTKKKDKDPRQRGELNLSIFSPTFAASTKKLSIRDLEKIDGDFKPDLASKKMTIDHSQKITKITNRRAWASSGEVDLGLFKEVSLSLELGTIKLVWENPQTTITLHLPRSVSHGQRAFRQDTYCRLYIENSSLKLRRCFKFDISMSDDDDDVLLATIRGFAISDESKSVRAVKVCFKTDLRSVVDIVSRDDHYEVVIDYGTDLLEACKKGQLEKINECLHRGDDVNQRNERAETPLHKAVALGDVKVIRALVEAGADPRNVDSFGFTPVDIAEKYFKKDLIPVLRSYH